MSRIFVEYESRRLGALAEAAGGIVFEYDREFLASGHELSPFTLPLAAGARSRDTPPSMRLPGLFEDSLPDQWGTRIMTESFRRRGMAEHLVTPLMRLVYVGRHGMGALSYMPESEGDAPPEKFSLADLYSAASTAEGGGVFDLNMLAQVGTSAGGARPKALIALNRSDRSVVSSGAGEIPDGFDAWIVKFDTTNFGDSAPVEEAYARMARAAGIGVSETCLLETTHAGKVRRHFATRRFDRENSQRIHHHSLACMLQMGPSDIDYSALLRVTRTITNDEREVWRAFRRAVFNVLAQNRDDHGKNHGFLYRNGQWSLGPAYDITFSGHLPERGMAVVGERRAAGTKQLLELAALESLDKRRAQEIINEVTETTSRWTEFAEKSGVSPLKESEIRTALRAFRTR
jgi:serine/threonine-protein kinase HipA